MAKLKPEFDKRGVKLMGLSVDPVENHAKWSDDITETQGAAPNYPMIGDTDLKVSKLYGMLPAATSGDLRRPHPGRQPTVRNVFIIGPDKKIKLVLVYPMTTGRNFHEILRVIDSMQLTAKHKVATPADWKQGGDVIITGAVSDDEAKTSIRRAGNRRSLISGSCRSRSSGLPLPLRQTRALTGLLRPLRSSPWQPCRRFCASGEAATPVRARTYNAPSELIR